ncbi:MAG: hypothetical protein A2887_03985 [Alphaproteobacteria bacterium RIFCSPLOWO2_01_FULL_40_26]|nr:MAG: hypothetical protein A3D15_04045 [Alphaproteobacteria bacterium RIFCSPHIGHO2_02_FULL_40_34]OFW94720.1 MAG: hypothetical protein A2887_03985 [Alphaproteobacteria bacterium RIFCSPLOWO2_01_FULL_40_26]OFX10352.1 MAG: hypothetical protein A3H30_05895 [Alphaproteobacteria bacterium RIFCSPLOWO2_02_FULL_40_19]OFX11140.1 MAG: hypothetical protein A3G22_02300 [Alphaproteobacteria bacterium RIFCSPLOWO2_12_FULL_40_11]
MSKNKKNTKITSAKKLKPTKSLEKISQTKVALNNYANLLSSIQKHIAQTQNNIIETVTRQKVVMAWQIGKIIEEHLSKNNKSGYGEELFKQLEHDIGITETVLYKMRSFYKTYPKLPKDSSSLNWSHYRILSGIKKSDERKYLEDLTKQNSWDVDTLQQEAKKSKNAEVLNEKESGNKKTAATKTSKKITNKKLYPLRGQLFSYPLTTIAGSTKSFFDLGFNIFREVEESLPQAVKKENPIVDVTKNLSRSASTGKNKSYSAKKSNLHPRKLYAYKAYLERVVDGDTIRVILDLGFKTFHEEILRLKGIDAPEKSTDAGKKSARVLTNILKNIPFLILKTIKIDIYGRYVADVFFDEKKSEVDPQKVADDGVYLNQMLLDKGSAGMLEE